MIKVGDSREYNDERERELPQLLQVSPSPTHGAEHDTHIQKKMSTFVDISLALQVGLEPTTP